MSNVQKILQERLRKAEERYLYAKTFFEDTKEEFNEVELEHIRKKELGIEVGYDELLQRDALYWKVHRVYPRELAKLETRRNTLQECVDVMREANSI